MRVCVCDVAYNRIVKKWQELGASEAIENDSRGGAGGGVASQGTGRASRTLTLCACHTTTRAMTPNKCQQGAQGVSVSKVPGTTTAAATTATTAIAATATTATF